MGYCCGTHLEHKVDSMVVEYSQTVDVMLLPTLGFGLSTLPQSCDYCDDPAKYLVSVSLDPIQWADNKTYPVEQTPEYVPLPTNYIGDIIPDPNDVTCEDCKLCGADTIKYYDPDEFSETEHLFISNLPIH